MQQIVPFLWFDTQALDAAEFYTSLVPGSRITEVQRYGTAGPGAEGTVMTVTFELDGRPYRALNGGPDFHLTEAFSLQVTCDSQAEVDRLWDALVAGGGEEGPCGWLKDRFGLSWQITPARLFELISDPDPAVSQPAMQAMLGMKKISVAGLEAAVAGSVG